MKRLYGVKMTLPHYDTLAHAHLLGEHFAVERWFPSKDARQNFLDGYQNNFIYYRNGDIPNLHYELIEK